MLDYIELNIKHKKKIYTSSTHKERTTICTVEDKPNQVYCSMKDSKREGGTGSSFTHRHEQEVEHGVAFECLHNSSITQWCRQSSGKQSHTWQYCVCSVVYSTVQVLAEGFCNQFTDFSSLYGPVYTSLLIFTEHFHSDTFFYMSVVLLQISNTRCDANYKLSVLCRYNTTQVTPCSTEHFLKCLLTSVLRLYSRSHKQQENCLYSECTE